MHPLQKFLSIALLAIPSFGSAFGQITVHVDPHAAGKPIPQNFLGLSFETSATLPDAKGHHPYFDPANQPLIQLFNTIGVKSLRIGGNTSDRPSVPIPATTDIDQVFAFAQRANVHVIYTLRLRDSTPPQVQLTASHIMEHYPDLVDCLVVGNEPNVYEHTYPKYAEDLKAFYPAVLSVAPRTKFCGPSTTPGSGTWVNSYIKDFHQIPQLYQVVQHSYPGGNSRKVTDPAAARANMLSASFEHDYQHLYDTFVPTALSSGVQYRIEETNSYYNGGAKDVSNTFASSLWALSYMYWWLAHDAQGINFHTGDQVAAGETQTPCWYAIFWNAPHGLEIHPIAYALAAFHIAGHGKLIPIDLSSKSDSLEAYATVADDGTIYLTAINKSFGSTGKQESLNIALPQGYAKVETMTLQAPKSDVAATIGIQLGGASIQPDGLWSGRWSKASLKHHNNVQLTLPPATALIVRMTPSTHN